MKILLSWLKDYIDINDPPSQIAKILTLAGLEVDAIEFIKPACQKVVVCRVMEVEKHPQADKLRLAMVRDGQETYQVVCGAENCRAGIKTALALVGSTVVNEAGEPFKVKKTKIRGIESLGMLCSPQELGLSSAHEGIIEFDEHIKEGMDVAELYADTSFEISLTPNLGHCASLIGVARELAAATNLPLIKPKITVHESTSEPISTLTSVDLMNKQGCPRYACRLIQNVAIGSSPEWLKKRLEASGIRSINNVVDVTNYVMLEMGHPLHAFDFELLEGKKVSVRNAKQGERIITLDGKERFLEEQDLLICDASKPVALAGIMGGLTSEVSDQTTQIFLEAAYFNPTSIRKTSKRLGLMTDASKRFERGTDPNVLIQALDRAAMLISEITGGKICRAVLDISTKTFEKKTIDCRLSRINKILGAHLSASEVENIFQRLEFNSLWDGQGYFKVTVPTYRNDLQEEIDLVEEVARLYGYDNIGKAPSRFHASALPHTPIFLFEREMRLRLIGEGLQEFLTCDLIGPSLLNIIRESDIPPQAQIRVVNPTSIEQSLLRTSLLPGLLQVVKYNWDHQNHNVAGFEIGRIHFKSGEQYLEQSVAGIVLSGKNHLAHWDRKPVEWDFFDLKGIFENILNELKIENLSFKPSTLNALHPGRQAAIFAGSLQIGSLGEIHPSVLRRLDVPQRILFAEINLNDLFHVKSPLKKMEEIPLYPSSERDWTLTLEESVSIEEVFEAIKKPSSRLLESIFLIDIYRSEKLGPNLKNVTLRFVYRDKNKTVSQEKVDAEHARILADVTKILKNGFNYAS